MHTLHLHASTGHPSEKPQPKTIISMLKNIIYDFNGYNKDIFLLINNNFSNEKIQLFFKYFTLLFNIESFAIYYITASMIFLSLIYKNMFDEKTYQNLYRHFVHVGIFYAMTGLTYAFLKFNINLPRPFCSIPDKEFYTIIDTSLERCLSSFPSAHIAVSIITTYAIWHYIGYIPRAFAILIIILTAISRIALAMHYPADILYSLIILLSVYDISKRIYRFFENNLISYFQKLIFKKLRF